MRTIRLRAWHRLAAILLVSSLHPPVAASAAPPPPAEAFARLPAMSMVTLAPDGKTIAYAGFQDGERTVFILDIATRHYLRRIVPSANDTLRGLDWASDRTLLLTLSQTQTNMMLARGRRSLEFFRVLALDKGNDSKGRVLLMDQWSRRYVGGASVLALHADKPDTVVMSTWSGGSLKGWTYSVFDVNTDTGKGDRIATGTGDTSRWIVDSAGRPVARSEWVGDGDKFRVQARHDDDWQTIYSGDDYQKLWPVCLDTDGKSLVAEGPRDGDKSRLWRIPLNGGPVSLLAEADNDIEGVITDRYTGRLAGYYVGGLDTTVQWLDPKMRGIDKSIRRAFPNSIVTVYDRTRDYSRVLAKIERSASPPVVYLVDLKKGTADTVGEAYPQLNGVPLGKRESVHYKARDGLDIPAYLTLPPGLAPKDLPLVVLPHGGPWARDEHGFDWMAEFLATRGYVVLQPQFRGSVGFGKALEKAGTRQWGRAMQDDLTDGVEHLVKEGIADKHRVCIVGGSYGGYAALAGAAFTPKLYVCAVSINGVSNLPRLMGYYKQKYGGESGALTQWRKLVGVPYEGTLEAASPSNSVDAIQIPILLIHGTQDSVVPYTQSTWFAKVLEDHGKTYELVNLQGEDHWLSASATRLQAMQATATFLARSLKGAGPGG